MEEKMEQLQLSENRMEKFLNKQSFEKYFPERDLFQDGNLQKYLQEYKVKKVLVVEDDFSQMNLMEELLLEINPETEIDWELEANTAIKTIVNESTKGRGYDVVISDIELGPGLSGMDLFRYCAESEPYIEPVLISAHSRRKLRRKHFSTAEPIDYFKKPINIEAFHQKMTRILN